MKKKQNWTKKKNERIRLRKVEEQRENKRIGDADRAILQSTSLSHMQHVKALYDNAAVYIDPNLQNNAEYVHLVKAHMKALLEDGTEKTMGPLHDRLRKLEQEHDVPIDKRQFRKDRKGIKFFGSKRRFAYRNLEGDIDKALFRKFPQDTNIPGFHRYLEGGRRKRRKTRKHKGRKRRKTRKYKRRKTRKHKTRKHKRRKTRKSKRRKTH